MPQEERDPRQVFVSARTGHDETGDGSESSAFRSLTRAFDHVRKQDDGSSWLLHVDIGEYGSAYGERFPILVPPSVQIQGFTSDGTMLDATGSELALLIQRGLLPTSIRELKVLGAKVACRVEARAEGAPPVRLTNLLFYGNEIGLSVADAEKKQTSRIEVADSRFRHNKKGIEAGGEGALFVRIRGTRFVGGEVGVHLHGPTVEDEVANHDVQVEASSFNLCETAGVWRDGEPGKAGSLVCRSTRFAGCGIGIRLDRPAGDSPLQLEHCVFEDNVRFGIRVIGVGRARADRSRITDCQFRWNGVGVQLFNAGPKTWLERCTFTDHLGAAISVARFGSEAGLTTIAHCLISGSGAAGVTTMADGQTVGLHLLQNTIAFNRGGGVVCRSKRSGTSDLEIRNCILAANHPNVIGVEPNEVHHCLFDSPLEDEWIVNKNFQAEPGFYDPIDRDLRLLRDSPARKAGGPSGNIRSDLMDLKQRPSLLSGSDLGALQYKESIAD